MYHRVLHFFMIPAAVLLLTVCTVPSKPDEADIFASEFQTFELTMADNPALSYDVTGRFEGDTIYLEYPDFSLMGYVLVASFTTSATSVEVDGVQQETGITANNFSTPVVYTLTASSGETRQFSVELVIQPGWIDMGVSPAVSPGVNSTQIQTGFLQDLNPFFLFIDNAFTLRTLSLDLPTGAWFETFGGPGGVSQQDTLSWGIQIATVYEVAGGIESQLITPTAGWSGVIPVAGTAGAEKLHTFKGSPERFFAAWIEDSLGARTPVVWTYDGAGWFQVGGGLTGFHADSFAAVSAGGSAVFAACTILENPGVLHFFSYDEITNVWTMIRDDISPFNESSQVIHSLFYDDTLAAPVVFTLAPGANDPGFSELRALYWSDTAQTWTNLDYIQPLIVSNTFVPSLDVSWYNNTPSVAVGNQVYTWSGDRWTTVGGTYTNDNPSVLSLSVGTIDTYMAAYRDDLAGGDLVVRYMQ